MKNFRKLSALVVLLVALSAPVLAGDMETPPAPVPPPPTAPATSEPAPVPGDMETPPAVMVVTETVLDLVFTVISLV